MSCCHHWPACPCPPAGPPASCPGWERRQSPAHQHCAHPSWSCSGKSSNGPTLQLCDQQMNKEHLLFVQQIDTFMPFLFSDWRGLSNLQWQWRLSHQVHCPDCCCGGGTMSWSWTESWTWRSWRSCCPTPGPGPGRPLGLSPSWGWSVAGSWWWWRCCWSTLPPPAPGPSLSPCSPRCRTPCTPTWTGRHRCPRCPPAHHSCSSPRHGHRSGAHWGAEHVSN